MGRATLSTAALLVLVSAALWSFSQASEGSKSSEDCCLSTGSMKIPEWIVTAYKIQLPGNSCKIHAVVFLTKHGKRLCAPPRTKWVKKLMDKIDNKGRRLKSLRRKKPRKSQNKRKRQA